VVFYGGGGQPAGLAAAKTYLSSQKVFEPKWYNFTLMRPLYLDYNATTPLLPEARAAMEPYWSERFANPASPHLLGKEAHDAVAEARTTLAQILGISPRELIFTSGATEALNLAIQGLAAHYKGSPRQHILVAATEHKAVLEPCLRLQEGGFEVEIIPVTSDGLVTPHTLQTLLRPTTLLVAIMVANNETGVIQPIQELVEITHSVGAFFLCDTTQAVGKMAISFSEIGVDMGVLSAHKFYGPKGVGALYIRRRSGVRLKPILMGGGHEEGLRSGTLPVPLIVGMAAALKTISERLPHEMTRLRHLRDKLETAILELYPEARIHGAGAERLPNTTNIAFPGIRANDLMARMPYVAVATGAACSSAKPEPSHVLLAMGASPEIAKSSLRFSLGLPTTEEDIELALSHLKKALASQNPYTYSREK
jgi:cysteine desulfurase